MLAGVKSWVRDRLPANVLGSLRRARRFTASLPYAGARFHCPLCGGRFRAMLPFGPARRANAKCPRCASVERHRLLWFYLRERTDFFTAPLRVLHFAAVQCMQEAFGRLANLDYVTADLVDESAMHRMDIADIRFPDASFDCVLSLHVLEHVPDDRRAMREILRVLRPGGWAILQVPIVREKTFEDPAIRTPEERLVHYGQEDHVRAYGLDYADRLREAGFEVTVDAYLSELDAALVDRCRLDMDGRRGERIYFCRKRGQD